MIEAWLGLPSVDVFVALTAFYAACGSLIVWMTHGRPFHAHARQFDGIVPPVLSVVAVLFALLTGFLASDIADRNRQASHAVQTEAAELRNLFTLSIASASDMHSIRAAWLAYVKAAVADDWPAMANGHAAASVDAAYDGLLREVSDPKIAVEAGTAVHSALLSAAVRVGTARSDRLALASDRSSNLKWAIVLLLGVMTQFAIGLVHLQRSAAQIAALTMFSVAVVIALGLIALQERPFAGPVAIGPTPLRDLLRQHPS